MTTKRGFKRKRPAVVAPPGGGESLGPFAIHEELHIDERVVVNRAVETMPNGKRREVALKRLRSSLNRSGRRAQSVPFEVLVKKSSYDHPNIARVHDFGRIDKTYFVASEFVAGRSLRSIADATTEAIPTHIITLLLHQLCDVLNYFEGTGGAGLHLDPATIIVGNNGLLRVTDMANGLPVLDGGESGDFVSVGSIAYELLCLRPPASSVQSDESLHPSAINPACPPALEAIVMKCLAGKFDCAGDVLDALINVESESRRYATQSEVAAWLKSLIRANEASKSTASEGSARRRGPKSRWPNFNIGSTLPGTEENPAVPLLSTRQPTHLSTSSFAVSAVPEDRLSPKTIRRSEVQVGLRADQLPLPPPSRARGSLPAQGSVKVTFAGPSLALLGWSAKGTMPQPDGLCALGTSKIARMDSKTPGPRGSSRVAWPALCFAAASLLLLALCCFSLVSNRDTVYLVRPGLLIAMLLTGCAFNTSTLYSSGASEQDGGPLSDGGQSSDGSGQGQNDAGQNPLADATVASATVGSFSDGFSNSAIGSEWSASTTSGCTLVETGSRIQFSMDGTSASRCVLTTAELYDLRGSAATIEIPAITNFRPQMYVFLLVSTPQDDRVEFGFNDGSFYASIVEATMEIFSGTSPYLPNPGYWRIRESGGQLYLESSINTSDWEIEFQQPLAFAVSSVRVSFGVETSGPMGSSIGIGVPGYNTVP